MSEPKYRIVDKAQEADVYIYEEIGADFFGEGMTAKRFVADMNALKSKQVNLHINSPGGSVFEGQTMATAIRNHPSKVTAYVDGLAASIASVIAVAADKVVMAKNALMMIHQPYGGVLGTAEDMRKMADTLDLVEDGIVTAYVDKSGKGPGEIREALAAETWLAADEAVAWGLADEVAEPVKAAAKFDLSQFRNAPIPTSPVDATDDDGTEAEQETDEDAVPVTDDDEGAAPVETPAAKLPRMPLP